MMSPLRLIADGARALLDGRDAFWAAHAGAHGSATSPWNALPKPTKAQEKAGNYPLGTVAWQGLTLKIENPAYTVREGVDPDGTPWRNVMKAHYGYFAGTRGADGDGVDVFLGPFPESDRVWVLNQRDARGAFDEHKVLAGFHDETAAVDAYRLSYTPGWDRYGPPIPLSLTQLRWWLQFADLTRELTLDLVPPEPEDMNDDTNTPAAAPTLSRVFWDSAAEPTSGKTLADVLYTIRASDAADGLVMDAMTMRDITEGAELIVLDALVTVAGKLKPKMEVLQRVMEAAGGDVKPVAMQLSEPMRRYGGVHVAALFELSDGQTITIWFHNPDSTPAKLTPMDDLVSWKWQLNKKDITIVVAPESGQDLNLREVARRIMRLATKNSPAFAKANGKRAAVMAEIEGLRTTLGERKVTLQGLMGQIEVAQQEKSDAETAVSDAWWNSRLDSEGVRVIATEMGFKCTTFGLFGKGSSGMVQVWKEGMPESVKITIELETDEKNRTAQKYRALVPAGAESFDLREVLGWLDEQVADAVERAKNDELERQDQARKRTLADNADKAVALWKSGDGEGAWALHQENAQLLGLPGSAKREEFFEGMARTHGPLPTSTAAAAGNPYGLSDAEMVVLLVTSGYKSFARMQNAMNETGISADAYNAARATLESKGFKVNSRMALLLTRGAITPEGAQVVKEFRPDIPFTDGKLRQFAGRFNEAVKPAPTPEPTPEPAAPTKTAADLGLEDASPEAVELLDGNDKPLAAAKQIEAAVKASGGAVSWVATGVEPEAVVFDAVKEDDPKILLSKGFIAKVVAASKRKDKTGSSLSALHSLITNAKFGAAENKPLNEDGINALKNIIIVGLQQQFAAAGNLGKSLEIRDKWLPKLKDMSRTELIAVFNALRAGYGFKPVLDSLFELDGARFVRGDITYKSRAMGSVTVNGTGQAFFSKADGTAFSGMPEEDEEAEDKRYAAAEGLLGWTSEITTMVGYMLDYTLRDPIDEEEASGVNAAENKADDDEQDGAAWPNTILDKSNPYWQNTLNDLREKRGPGVPYAIGYLEKGSQTLIASAVYRGKNAAAWYIVLTKPGQRKMLENIPFPSITGAFKMGKVAAILMGYLDADEASGFKIAPPDYVDEASAALAAYTEKVQMALEAQGATTSDAQGVIEANETQLQALFLAGTAPSEAASRLGGVGTKPAELTVQNAPFIAFHVDGFKKFTVIVKNEPGMGSKDARSDAISAAKAEMGGGATRVKEEAIPLAAVPEGAWKGKGAADWAWFMLGYIGETTPEPQPAPTPTESAEAKFLREVGAGVHDALDLGEMLAKIEASVAAMQAAGQLAGDNDPVADAAILHWASLHWASLEEKANG